MCVAGKWPGPIINKCVDCTAGTASLGDGDCVPCDEQGKVASSDQSRCESCGPGKQPNADRTACEFCVGTSTSAFGIKCDGSECLVGLEYANHINPATCTSRTGGKCMLNAEQTSCENKTSDGCVFTIGHTICTRCAPGSGPKKPYYDGCDACATGKYSSDGVCKECGSGEVPIADVNATGCEDEDECAWNGGNGPCDIIAEKIGTCTTTNGRQVCTSPCRNEPPVRIKMLCDLRPKLCITLSVCACISF